MANHLVEPLPSTLQVETQTKYNHLTLSVDFYVIACLVAGVSSHNRKYIQVHPSLGAKVAHGAFPSSPGHTKVALRIQNRWDAGFFAYSDVERPTR